MRPVLCDSCLEAGVKRAATCYLEGQEWNLCEECARELQAGIRDGIMGGNPSLDGVTLEILPLPRQPGGDGQNDRCR